MGKKRKPQRVEREVQDKPDWAADWFRPQPKPEKPDKAKQETQLSVEDHLDNKVVNKLTALKSAMEQEAAKETAANGQAKSASKHRNAGKSQPRTAQDDDGNISFSELFDPPEEDEASFADLLKDSKLDWRSFKK